MPEPMPPAPPESIGYTIVLPVPPVPPVILLMVLEIRVLLVEPKR